MAIDAKPTKTVELELSKEEIERQDFVDNLIYASLYDFVPSLDGRTFGWDIEAIAAIRDVIADILCDYDVCTPGKFYPRVRTREVDA